MSVFRLIDWIKAGISEFDRQEEYEEHVKPLAEALQAECEKRGFSFSTYICHTQKANGDNIGHAFHHMNNDLSQVPAEAIMQVVTDVVSADGLAIFKTLGRADQLRCLIATKKIDPRMLGELDQVIH